MDTTSPTIECTVAIFEMQDRDAVIARLGEWRLERALERLDAVLGEALLAAPNGAPLHQIDRAAGGVEMVAVLNGPDRREVLGRLQAAVAAFQRETGLRVVAAWSDDESGRESLGALFSRAELALHERRGEALAAAA